MPNLGKVKRSTIEVFEVAVADVFILGDRLNQYKSWCYSKPGGKPH
jgi:hypothetical protein